MTTEQQLRDALRSVADAGPDPDVDAAWDQLQHRLRDGAAPGRGRWVLVAGAALAAAAALVLLTTRPDTEQSVDVGVADGSDTAPPDDRTHQSAVGVPITLPADPVAVLGPEGAAVHVMDPATGVRASTVDGLAGRRAIAAAATPTGDVFLALQDGDRAVLAEAGWDTGVRSELFASDPGSSIADLAVDPSGGVVALGVLDAAGRGSITVVDRRGPLVVRDLRWPDGDERGELTQPQQLSFSPDGTQLAFVNVHDTDGTEGFEAYVVDVDAPDLGAARRLTNEGWEGTWDRVADVTFAPASLGGIVAVTRLGDGDAQVRFVEGGPDQGLPVLDGVVSVQASEKHLVARTGDAWYALDPAADAWRPIGFEDWTG